MMDNCGQVKQRISIGLEKMALGDRNGQGFIEYVVLIMVISAAIIAMTVYIMRSTNARLSQERGELDYYKAER